MGEEGLRCRPVERPVDVVGVDSAQQKNLLENLPRHQPGLRLREVDDVRALAVAVELLAHAVGLRDAARPDRPRAHHARVAEEDAEVVGGVRKATRSNEELRPRALQRLFEGLVGAEQADEALDAVEGDVEVVELVPDKAPLQRRSSSSGKGSRG